MKDLKKIVRDKYAKIALQEQKGCGEDASCCGPSDSKEDFNNIMAESYETLEGYNVDADLGLGCGLPTAYAKIKPGQTVVDLGSGAGNDCFVARAETGDAGRVIGLDFTEEMVQKAREHATKLGYHNVEFVYGDIEAMPLSDNLADVVVSNCVFNLVPNKAKAFEETYRILKPNGHFSISDIVVEGTLPDGLQHDAEMYSGCVSGAIQKSEYLNMIEQAGFRHIEVQKQRGIKLPKELLAKYLSPVEMETFNQEVGIFSITVYAEK